MHFNRSILVADDEQSSQITSRSLIYRAGHKVVTVINGHLAVERCKTQLFDIIILDINMPIMDGVSCMKAIRRLDNGNQNATIVALTAHVSALKMRNLIEIGFDDAMSKPMTSQSVQHIIAKNNSKFNEQNKTAPVELDKCQIEKLLSGPVIDNNITDILFSILGMPNALEVLASFWCDAESMIRSLTHIRFNDETSMKAALDKIYIIATTLSRSAANLGLRQLSELAFCLKSANIIESAFLIEQLEEAAKRTREELTKTFGP